MFSQLSMAPPDAILGLTDAFKKDPNPDKINLGVGVYQDESGKTPVFSTVAKAERLLLDRAASKTYLPIQGADDYGAAVRGLLFGSGHALISDGRAATAHTPGGTGALRVAADFIKTARPEARVWLSDPTWANHPAIFAAAGLAVSTYPYYDAESKSLDFEAMMRGVEAIPEGDVIVLHGCCHNPTGLDPTPEQWEGIGQAVRRRGLTPLVDFAYQGLADGIEEDAAAVRRLAATGGEMLIASSFSKNFGLYSERVGALTALGASKDETERAFSHVKRSIRANYSNPPSHGGDIVRTVLGDASLRREWEGEVAAIRDRIRRMRSLFVETLKAKGVKRDFSYIARQNGMFSFSGLNNDQVAALRDRYSIYVVGGGRINVAGMTTANMDRLCLAIAEVLGE